jgi:hypothetical protein
MATIYRYLPLDDSRNETRLIILLPSRPFKAEVTCRLFYQLLDDNHRFEALSYTWGDPNSKLPLSLNGREIKVTKNLDKALCYLRYADDQRILWIDALCINQEYIPERNQQVAAMHKIYQRAAKVIVWLGPASKNGNFAFDLLAEASSKKIEIDDWLIRNLKMRSRSKFWEAYCDIADCDYWGRVWIIQEIFFASSAIVRCGFCCMRWPDFIFLFHSIMCRSGNHLINMLNSQAANLPKIPNAFEELYDIMLLPKIIESSSLPPFIDNWKKLAVKSVLPLELLLELYRNSVFRNAKD